jgi:hypothetical protein
MARRHHEATERWVRIVLMEPQNYPEFAERLSQVAQAM